jgi:elongation factor P--(R)-beta-lysine ligase
MTEPSTPELAHRFEPSASIEMLQARSQLLQHLRGWFIGQGYWECQTPILSRERIIDANIELYTTTDESGTWYLQPSPEACMKRILAAGANAIFQIGPAMRVGEKGDRHNAEFTIVEWYKVGDTYFDQMTFTQELVRSFYDAAAPLRLSNASNSNQRSQSPAAFDRITYDEAFERFVGSKVLHLEPDELTKLAQRHDVCIPDSMEPDRDSLLNLLLAELVEPNLGQDAPQFLYDYPASQAALAKIATDSTPNIAMRFELYDRGIELCNGYQELTDADTLIERSRHEMELRHKQSSSCDEIPNTYPKRLAAAMTSGLPECSGVALGFDRLVMLGMGASSIEEVVAFPSHLA